MLGRREPSSPRASMCVAALATALSSTACASLIDPEPWELAASASVAQGTGGDGASGGGSVGGSGAGAAGGVGPGGAGGRGGAGGGGSGGASMLGSAVNLADDGYIDLQPTLAAAPASGFTWELWFKGGAIPTDPSDGRAQMLLCAADTTPCEDIHLGFGTLDTPKRELAFKLDGDGECGNAVDSTPLHYAPDAGFENGTWYHVAVVVDYGNDVERLFVNAVVVDQKSTTAAPLPQTLNFNAGRFFDGGTSESHFHGAIDEIRVYAAPLSQVRIAQHYNGGAGAPGDPNEVDLALGWRFDDGMGTTALAYSPSDPSATLENTTQWVTGIVPTP